MYQLRRLKGKNVLKKWYSMRKWLSTDLAKGDTHLHHIYSFDHPLFKNLWVLWIITFGKIRNKCASIATTSNKACSCAEKIPSNIHLVEKISMKEFKISSIEGNWTTLNTLITCKSQEQFYINLLIKHCNEIIQFGLVWFVIKTAADHFKWITFVCKSSLWWQINHCSLVRVGVCLNETSSFSVRWTFALHLHSLVSDEHFNWNILLSINQAVV